jgi:hypothetical protein
LQGNNKAQSYAQLAAAVRASGGEVAAALEELAASEQAAEVYCWGHFYTNITSAADVRLQDVKRLFIRVGTVDPVRGLFLSNHLAGASYKCALRNLL